MKKIFAFCVALLCAASVFSENKSALAAARRTAKRYLQLSKQHAANREWAEADSEAQIGLAYDEGVADLWYIRAAARANLGGTHSEVLPLVEKSLDSKKTQWVDYNRDNARVLYADQLAGTLQFKEALSVLDEKPLIYSADAEFIRIQCYYSLGEAGDGASVEKARDRVDSARKVYPDDVRFAELFYNHEYALANKGSMTLPVLRIAESFFPMMKNYKDASDDLHLLSISFIANAEERVRKLKAFASEGKESVLYPLHALLDGIIDESHAIDQFCSFADASSSQQPLRLSVLENFAKNIPSEEARKSFAEYLLAFDGVVSADTDGDLCDNLVVSYKRGRPEKMTFDKNQDGIPDWSAECDFGTPTVVQLSENNVRLEYSQWPFLKYVVYSISEGDEITFNLISETLSWSPFEMGADPVLASSLGGIEFFVPLIPLRSRTVSGRELLVSSSSYSRPSKERDGAVVSVSVLDGVPQSALYSANGKVYAHSQFEDGLPLVRLVDSDGDGLFETTEHYGMTDDLSKMYITESDEMQIITNLFGTEAKGTGFYVKLIQLDIDGDTIPDFSEEYTEGFGKISSWDTDSDGNWDVRYTKKPRMNDKKPLVEIAEFHQPGTNGVVSVTSENGVPMNVTLSLPPLNGRKAETIKLRVFKSSAYPDLFWLADKDSAIFKNGSFEDASFESDIVRAFADGGQGLSKLVEVDNARFHAVRIGGRIFVEQMTAAPPIQKPSERRK